MMLPRGEYLIRKGRICRHLYSWEKAACVDSITLRGKR